MARQTEKILRVSILESKGKLYKMVGKELPDKNWMEVLVYLLRKDMLLLLNSIVIARQEISFSLRIITPSPKYNDSSLLQSVIMLAWSSEMIDMVFASFNPMEAQESVWPCGLNSSGTNGSKIFKAFSGEDSTCKTNLKTSKTKSNNLSKSTFIKSMDSQ